MSNNKIIIIHGSVTNLSKSKTVYVSLVAIEETGSKSFSLHIHKNYDSWNKTRREYKINLDYFEDESGSLDLTPTEISYSNEIKKPQPKENKKCYPLDNLFHVQHLSRGFKSQKSESIFNLKGLLKPRAKAYSNQDSTSKNEDSLGDASSVADTLSPENSSIPLEVLPNRSVLGLWLVNNSSLVLHFNNAKEASKWFLVLKEIIKINQKNYKFLNLEFAWPVCKVKVKPSGTSNQDSFCNLVVNRNQKSYLERLNLPVSSRNQNYPLYFCLGKKSVVFIKGEPDKPILEIKYPLIRQIGYRIDSVFELIPSRAAGENNIQLTMKNIFETRFAFFQCESLMEKRSSAANFSQRSLSNSLTSDTMLRDSRRKINNSPQKSNDRLSDKYPQSKKISNQFLGHSSIVERSMQKFYDLKSVDMSIPSLNNINEEHRGESNVNTADTLMPFLDISTENNQANTLTEEYVDVEANDQKLSCKDMIGSSEISAANMETMMWIANLEEKNIKAKAQEVDERRPKPLSKKKNSEFDSSFSSIGSYSAQVKSRIKLCSPNDCDFTSRSGIGTNSFNSSSPSNSYMEDELLRSNKAEANNNTEGNPDPETIFKVLNYLKKSIAKKELSSNEENSLVIRDFTRLMSHSKVENILSQMIEPNSKQSKPLKEDLNNSEILMRSEKLERFFTTVMMRERKTIASCSNRSEFNYFVNTSGLLAAQHHSPSEDIVDQNTRASILPIFNEQNSLSSLSTEKSSSSSLGLIENKIKTKILKTTDKFPKNNAIKSHRENSNIFAEVSYPTNLSNNSKDVSDYNLDQLDQMYSMNLDNKTFRKRISSDGNNFKLSKLFSNFSMNQKGSDLSQRSQTFSTYSHQPYPISTNSSGTSRIAAPSIATKMDTSQTSSIKKEGQINTFLDDNYSEREYLD